MAPNSDVLESWREKKTKIKRAPDKSIVECPLIDMRSPYLNPFAITQTTTVYIYIFFFDISFFVSSLAELAIFTHSHINNPKYRKAYMCYDVPDADFRLLQHYIIISLFFYYMYLYTCAVGPPQL